MVKVDIDDEVWEVFKRSWALFGIRTDEALVRMLEDEIWEHSDNVLNGA